MTLYRIKYFYLLIPLMIITCVNNGYPSACPVNLISFEGKVIYSNGNSIPGSQIILTNTNDIIVARTFSDINGRFNFEINPGAYKFIISYNSQTKTENLIIDSNTKNLMKLVKFDEGFLKRNQSVISILIPIFSVFLSILGTVIFWAYQNKRKKKKSIAVFQKCICEDLTQLLNDLENTFDNIYRNLLDSERRMNVTIKNINYKIKLIKDFISIWENIYGSILIETMPERIAALQKIKFALNNIDNILLQTDIIDWLRLEKDKMDNARQLLMEGLHMSCQAL
jgi:hypothetical protein